jgi:hypothetical protein
MEAQQRVGTVQQGGTIELGGLGDAVAGESELSTGSQSVALTNRFNIS